jgi:LasA protease
MLIAISCSQVKNGGFLCMQTLVDEYIMLIKNVLFAVAMGLVCVPAHAEDPVLVLTEQDLIYNNKLMLSFSIEDYLRTHAPHLLPHAEAISHWAGYTTISPKILLALMEHQSSIVSSESEDNMSRPFGKLSEKNGFNEQLRDISNELATLHYAQSKEPNPEFSVVKLLSVKSSKQTSTNRDSSQISKSFSQTYYRLFSLNSH